MVAGGAGAAQARQRVSSIIPEFAANERKHYHFRSATHQSGLLPDNAVADYEHGREEAIKKICELKLQAPTGTRFIYRM